MVVEEKEKEECGVVLLSGTKRGSSATKVERTKLGLHVFEVLIRG